MNPIGQIRHLNRYRQIVLVFAKHGFGVFLDQLGIFKYLKLPRRATKTTPTSRLSVGERLRLSLAELGPAFIKLGQLVSTRPELLPPAIIAALEGLQDAVPSIPFAEVRTVVEGELGAGLAELFREFDEQPLAAASIAQVHRACLPDGQAVVVKAQRPGIERLIEEDLSILEDLAIFLDQRTKYGKLYNFRQMVGDFGAILRNELNFRNEAGNAERMRQNVAAETWVVIPRIHWSHCARRVLTMEYIAGVALTLPPGILAETGLQPKAIARNLAATILYQMLRDGFFHADPHPGNIKALPGNRIALLDLGMVGRLSDDRRAQFLNILTGFSFSNDRLIVQALVDLGMTESQPISLRQLEREVGRIREKYLTLAVEAIKVGEMFRELFGMAFRFQLTIPEEFAMLGKALIIVESSVANLDPELSLIEIAKPIARRLLLERLNPGNLGSDLLRQFLNYGLVVNRLPAFLLNFLIKFEERDFAVQIRIAEWQQITVQLNRLVNRIALSIILLAVSIVIAGIIVGTGIGGIITEFRLVETLRWEVAVTVAVVLGLLIILVRTNRI